MVDTVTAIRIHIIDEAGVIFDAGNEFNLKELADTVPAVGDLIVDPGVLQGRDRRDPSNRTILEVVARYFLPGAHQNDVYVAVVVKERVALERESVIACLS